MKEKIEEIINKYASIQFKEIDEVSIKINGRTKSIWLIKLTINENEYVMDVLINGNIEQNIEKLGINIQWNLKYV